MKLEKIEANIKFHEKNKFRYIGLFRVSTLRKLFDVVKAAKELREWDTGYEREDKPWVRFDRVLEKLGKK